MVAAMAVVSSMALGASAALEAIPDGWVFDPEYYAAQNPDVVQVVGTDTMALYNHYRQSGNKEGRKPYDESVYSKDDVKRFYAENFKRSDAQPIEIERVIFTVNSAFPPSFCGTIIPEKPSSTFVFTWNPIMRLMTRWKIK